MKNYFKATIQEQINKGMILKDFIPTPLEHKELTSLANKCISIIDESINELKFLIQKIENIENNDFRYILRSLRRCSKNLELVESFGISALYHQTDEFIYFNRFIYQLCKEIQLPITAPSVACISTHYYYYQPFIDVIFLPIGESKFLLYLSILLHEIGHSILFKRKIFNKLKPIDFKYNKIINMLTEHYKRLYMEKYREFGPRSIPEDINFIHYQWKNYWIDEFLSDLFALYISGPAYAYTFLHVVLQKSKNIYKIFPIIFQDHPSDESRMRLNIIGLKQLGFLNQAREIEKKWMEMPFVTMSNPVNEYYYAYSDDLLKEVASIFLEALRENKFKIFENSMIKNESKMSIIKILNDAWKCFWERPNEFRKWEENTIEKLKNRLNSLKF
ncbi:MAG: hypothetical protein ACTSRP_17890 [Candidatus Helarchaeota archaeon]